MRVHVSIHDSKHFEIMASQDVTCDQRKHRILGMQASIRYLPLRYHRKTWPSQLVARMFMPLLFHFHCIVFPIFSL